MECSRSLLVHCLRIAGMTLITGRRASKISFLAAADRSGSKLVGRSASTSSNASFEALVFQFGPNENESSTEPLRASALTPPRIASEGSFQSSSTNSLSFDVVDVVWPVDRQGTSTPSSAVECGASRSAVDSSGKAARFRRSSLREVVAEAGRAGGSKSLRWH